MQLPDFSHTRLLVAGDLMLDRYWHGGASRISPEAPVPVVRVTDIEERVGGAGNVALNLAALGGQVTLVGFRGDDEPGQRLAALLNHAGIRIRVATVVSHPTITKLRVISRHQQLIRLDFEEDFSPVETGDLRARYADALPDSDSVVFSDYGKGTLGDIPCLIELARNQGKPVLVDPKGSDYEKYRGATLLTPNRAEFELVAGTCADEAHLVERGRVMIDALELEALLITRGEQGMTLLQRGGQVLHLPAHAKEVYDVTGAGDTVIATLAAGLSAGMSLTDATRLANLAAGLVVGKLGTATIAPAELVYALQGSRALRRGIVAAEELPALLAQARADGERIVATNGCFDILHPGHVDYLQRARALGDRLIVLVNSDASVRRLKGPERPINPLAHRMTLLAALECVDWVTSFEEDTPRDLIGRVLPDILVKGGDYSAIESIAGHDHVLAHGGEVCILPFVAGHSTTRLIDRIAGRSSVSTSLNSIPTRDG